MSCPRTFRFCFRVADRNCLVSHLLNNAKLIYMSLCHKFCIHQLVETSWIRISAFINKRSWIEATECFSKLSFLNHSCGILLGLELHVSALMIEAPALCMCVFIRTMHVMTYRSTAAHVRRLLVHGVGADGAAGRHDDAHRRARPHQVRSVLARRRRTGGGVRRLHRRQQRHRALRHLRRDVTAAEKHKCKCNRRALSTRSCICTISCEVSIKCIVLWRTN